MNGSRSLKYVGRPKNSVMCQRTVERNRSGISYCLCGMFQFGKAHPLVIGNVQDEGLRFNALKLVVCVNWSNRDAKLVVVEEGAFAPRGRKKTQLLLYEYLIGCADIVFNPVRFFNKSKGVSISFAVSRR